MMQQGEKYQCGNPDCGCEISVTRGSEAEDADENPKCCCGEEMELMESTSRATGRAAPARGAPGRTTRPH